MQVKITLSRLHKLVERIKDRLKDLNDAASALGAAKAWRASPTSEALAGVREGVEQGFAAAREALALSTELAKVRAAIAAHNERLGQNMRLAQHDALNAQLRALKATLTAATGLDRIEELPVGAPVGQYGQSTSSLTRADLAELQRLIDDTQRDVYRISDEIAEANATRVELDLRDDIAALVNA